MSQEQPLPTFFGDSSAKREAGLVAQPSAAATPVATDSLRLVMPPPEKPDAATATGTAASNSMLGTPPAPHSLNVAASDTIVSGSMIVGAPPQQPAATSTSTAAFNSMMLGMPPQPPSGTAGTGTSGALQPPPPIHIFCNNLMMDSQSRSMQMHPGEAGSGSATFPPASLPIPASASASTAVADAAFRPDAALQWLQQQQRQQQQEQPSHPQQQPQLANTLGATAAASTDSGTALASELAALIFKTFNEAGGVIMPGPGPRRLSETAPVRREQLPISHTSTATFGRGSAFLQVSWLCGCC